MTQKTAVQATKRLQAGNAPKPFIISAPVRVTIDFNATEQADQAALYPGAKRVDGRRLTFTANDMLAAYLGFQAVVAMVSL
jgi:D-aminopeptidase